jgi:hypothetical protein
MTRYARSAKTLIDELSVVVPDLEVERDDLDGLGVWRTLRFTSTTHKGLDDVVSAVADERIVSHRSITKGVEVTFHDASRLADLNHKFGVSDAGDLISKKRTRKSSN